MRHAIAAVMLFGVVLADVQIGVGQPFPSSGSPNPAMTGARDGELVNCLTHGYYKYPSGSHRSSSVPR